MAVRTFAANVCKSNIDLAFAKQWARSMLDLQTLAAKVRTAILSYPAARDPAHPVLSFILSLFSKDPC